MKVLFVCRANVGRSQMAEAFYNEFTKSNDAFSAGTHVNEKAGQKIKDNEKAKFVVDVMKEENVDISNNERKQLTPEMVERAERVVIISDKNDLPDYLKNSEKTIFWDIADAKDQSYKFHIEIRDKIKGLVKELIGNLILQRNKL